MLLWFLIGFFTTKSTKDTKVLEYKIPNFVIFVFFVVNTSSQQSWKYGTYRAGTGMTVPFSML
jgi:hypothetical protein